MVRWFKCIFITNMINSKVLKKSRLWGYILEIIQSEK
jgi:hypothetical protein